jgi:nitrogen fixation-related uncharacterized protein
MTSAALYILGVCAGGALIAVAAFLWAGRRGEFSDASEARFLVFDEDEEPAAREAERRDRKR